MNRKYRIKTITKPFWVPAITAVYLLIADSPLPAVLTALFFGYIGDLLLMRRKKSWFVAGAFSFLIGHLFYIYTFILNAGGISVFSEHPLISSVLLLPYAGYAIFLKRLTGNNVSSVFYAAAVYFCVLMLMSYTSLLRVWNVNTASFLLTFCGTILFIISDTLIGIRNFKRKIKGTEKLIVATYISAQLLIVSGLAWV